ncbi:hypothetical protein [uncultured Cytophaga sp.]|uniref:hypothetical protein n=1 Tax=uncultured Cytophaga sp. TaxID=160238 RepID=UPI00260FC4E7|nr:hypothetical protein [uncultured Cytophaga sp.]
MKREILTLLFYSIVFFASAQSSSNIPIQKKYKETLFQFAPRVDLAFDKIRLNLYLAGAINADHAYKSLVENRKWYSQLGLDLGLSEKWYVGISNRINGGSTAKNSYNYTTKAYVQHRGKIKSLLFLKEFIYEQFNYSNNTQVQIGPNGTSYSRRPAIGRIGLGLGIGRHFNENKFAVFISYKAFVQTDYGDKRNELFKNRLIDYTNARIDLGYLVNKTWYAGIYISRDTYYSYIPASTPYNSNTITPIVGLAFNLILHSKRTIDKPLNSFRYFYTY